MLAVSSVFGMLATDEVVEEGASIKNDRVYARCYLIRDLSVVVGVYYTLAPHLSLKM